MADNNSSEESIRKEQQARDEATKSAKQFSDVIDDLIKRNKSAEDKLKSLNKELDTGKKRFVDIGPALESLRESIDDVVDVDKKAALYKELEVKEAKARNAQYTRAVLDGAGVLATGLASAGINIAKSVIGSYQSNSSAFQTAGDAAIAGLDASNQTVKGFAAVANTAGAGLMFLGPKGIAAGLALQGIATVATFLTEKFTDLAKFGINVAVKELENTTKSFSQLSNAGALFSQGLGEIRRTAGEAGLTQEQFSKVIVENREAMAMFGGSVGNGAKQFANISKNMAPFRAGLLSLGYSIEELSEGTAQYMALQATSGQGQRRDYANLAKETDAYLTNLKVITAFSGEDAKKAQARAREASTQTAVDAKLRRMDVGARERFESSIMTLAPEMQKAAMQMFESGVITDPALAQAFYNNKEAMEVLTNSVGYVKDSNLKAGDVSRKMQEDQQRLREGMLRSADAFASGTGRANLLTGAFGDLEAVNRSIVAYAKKETIPGDKTATRTAEEQKETQDKLTKSYRDATVANQELKIKIQDELTVAITKFAEVTKDVISGIRNSLSALGIKTGAPAPATGPNQGTPAAPFQSPSKSVFDQRREEFEKRKATPVTPAVPPVSSTKAPGPTVTATGLKLKPGAEQKGKSADILYEVANSVAGMLGGDYKYFSGFKDRDGDSAHASGRAFDLVLNNPEKYADTLAKIKGMEAIKYAQFEKKGQRNPNGSVASGDHIHAEIKAAQGGVVASSNGGSNVNVGEGGQDELITPLRNGKLPGMDELIEKVAEMISVMKDQRDISERTFSAIQ